MTKIALRQARQIAAELHQERLVEAKLMADVLDRLGGGRPARDLAHRIGGQDVEQEECDRGDAEKDQDGGDKTADQIGGHHSAPRCVGSSTSRSASPTRLKASASSRIVAPGMKTSQGAA